jgi:hypothetical protein
MNLLTKLGIARPTERWGSPNRLRRPELPVRELGSPIVIPGARTEGLQGYSAKRRHFMYYVYIDRLMRVLAADVKSLLDVGSANMRYLEAFDWIPERYALDRGHHNPSQGVTPIKADFLQFRPERKYDFVTCFQVLEHIPDATTFGRRLFEMADRALISVPYMWPENRGDKSKNKHTSGHVHDPINLAKLSGWLGREPDYYIVVDEPFGGMYGRRLIAYYDNGANLPSRDVLVEKLKESATG